MSDDEEVYNPYGMAVRISKETADKIAIVNGGFAPIIENIVCYFIFPYDPEEECQILDSTTFFNNWKFIIDEDDEFGYHYYFVDILEA